MEYTISNFSYDQLKAYCRDNKIKGFSKYTNKPNLKQFILNNLPLHIDSNVSHPTSNFDPAPQWPFARDDVGRSSVGSTTRTSGVFDTNPNEPAPEDQEIHLSDIVLKKLNNSKLLKLLNTNKDVSITFIDKKYISYIIMTDDINVYIIIDRIKYNLMYYEPDNIGFSRGYLENCSTKTKFIFEDIIYDGELFYKIIGINSFKLFRHIIIDMPYMDILDRDLLQFYVSYKETNPSHNIILKPEYNRYSYEMYDTYRNHFLENSREFKEKLLFHGTSKENINSILQNGLTLTNNVKHGKVHGNGVYFTDDIDFAMKYPKTLVKDRCVVVFKVAVNNIIEGRKAIENFPLIPDTFATIYDTGVDYINNPKQYIKKDKEQYKITGVLYIKSTTLKKTITIVNKTNYKLYIYHNHTRQPLDQYMDIQKCTLLKIKDIDNTFYDYMNTKMSCNLDIKPHDEYIVGFYNNSEFSIYKVCKVGSGSISKNGNEIFYIGG